MRRTTPSFFLAAALLMIVLGPPLDAEPPTAPILRVKTGMHTAPITRIDVDAGERFLVTGSHDKTVRVWDIETAELLRVLRPPIGEGSEGKIYAVAITPDGELVAAGGWTGYSWDGENSIYLFDRRTGRLVRRIAGLPSVVFHLAFSPDGKRLAATLGGANGLRVFRVADGEELFRDTSPEDDSFWADFDTAGRLVTSSFDGKLRLYSAEHERLATCEPPGGERPFAVAFSPDSKHIAVGYHDSTRVDVLSAVASGGSRGEDGVDLEPLFHVDTSGTNNELGTVAWSADGTKLFAAGSYDVRGMNPIRRWTDTGRGPARDLDGPTDTVMGLHALADGRFVVGSADPAWSVRTQDGERLGGREPAGADMRGLLDDFRVDRSGDRLRFAFEPLGKRPAVFALPDRRLVVDPPAAERFDGHPLKAPRTTAPELEITDWNSTDEPSANGEPLALKTYETSFSLAIAPDATTFLLGTAWSLRSFTRDGKERWRKLVPGIAWSVNLTPDGRLALAAFGDDTIRWYRADNGEELLAFFPHADGKRWVLWTPSGYYDASADGEDLIGWHVNRGRDQAADFYPAHAYRDIYHQPAVIDHILDTLDEADALRRAGVRTPRLATATPPPSSSTAAKPPPPPPPPTDPPIVTILEPAEGDTFSTSTIKLRLNVRSPSGAPVDKIHLAVDGRPLETRGATWTPNRTNQTAKDFYEERDVPLPPRDTVIEARAEAGGRLGPPDHVRLAWSAPAPPAERRVWVLAVGVSKYERPAYELGYAAKDANDVAAAWKKLEGRIFHDVETRVLTDTNATRDDILDALDWLAAAQADNLDDLVVIFLAGHGINADGKYFFLPHDADPERRNRTFLSQSHLYDSLGSMPGRTLLFLDTCRAGSLTASTPADEVRKLVDPNSFVSLMSTNAGVIVYSATARRQLSQESSAWGNGAFSAALVDALGGTADRDGDGAIFATELEQQLGETVKKRTDGAQTPTAAKGALSDFAVVPKELPR